MSQFNLPKRCARCLAEEPAQSWNIEAEGTEPTPVPICQACHGHLKRRCRLFWLPGVVVGAVAAEAVVHYLPQFFKAFDRIPVAILMGGLLAIVGLVAWGTAELLRSALVDNLLATYEPSKPRIKFGNKEYQALFNRANEYALGHRGPMSV
ncbi:MAG: hypothetical protein L0211_15095 [Planctomycetaceae bacterium]|nr:hypothetical protein [Planctomycetaceae bacterium]